MKGFAVACAIYLSVPAVFIALHYGMAGIGILWEIIAATTIAVIVAATVVEMRR